MKYEEIKSAAKKYYVENVEGEPLDQNTPIKCFIEGAKFIIAENKKSNKKTEPTYNNIKKIMNIIEISGFYIISKGDSTVGINDAQWELQENFYFDNQEELEIFRNELKSIFENYCGDVTILTFEEQAKRNIDEEMTTYQQYPVRYLIRDKGYNMYKEADFCASYSSNIGDGIHLELPSYISEKGDCETEVIKSTDLEFKKILLDEARQLESNINNYEYKLSVAKRNLELIMKELKYGK